MTQEILGSNQGSIIRIKKIQKTSHSLHEVFSDSIRNGTVYVQKMKTIIFKNSLTEAIRNEIGEIRYDLAQRPGHPPIDTFDG